MTVEDSNDIEAHNLGELLGSVVQKGLPFEAEREPLKCNAMQRKHRLVGHDAFGPGLDVLDA